MFFKDTYERLYQMSDGKLYISVENKATAEITEKKSRFIANVCHVETEKEAMDFVDKIKKEHYSARHNVYAFILSNGFKKYTDDGEPSKTAGLPILEMLEKQGITDVVCVVTRYFGGTLLGTGGLVRAYTESAKLGVESAGVVVMTSCELMELAVPYHLLGSVEHLIKKSSAICEDKLFGENVNLTVVTESANTISFAESIKNEFGGSVNVRLKGKVYRKI